MSKNGNAIHGIFFHKKFGQSKFNGKKTAFLLIDKCVSIGTFATLAANGGSLEPNHSTPTAQGVQGSCGVLSKHRVKRRVSLGRNRSLGTWPW